MASEGAPKRIEQFFHCAKCLRENPGLEPYQQNVEVGMTDTGSIQVWCRTHDCQIINLNPPKALEHGTTN